MFLRSPMESHGDTLLATIAFLVIAFWLATGLFVAVLGVMVWF